MKLTSAQVVQQVNNLINAGIISTALDANKATSCIVWGARTAVCGDVTWSETKSRFLGGGIYESWGYTLTCNGQSVLIRDYVTSLRMLLNYVKKHQARINA